MKLNKYPDGTSYVIADNVTAEPIIRKINTYEELHHLEQEIDAINNFIGKSFRPTVIIPNLIDAQADRRFAKNQSSGLKIVCKRLNSMNADFRIFHPHNPEVVEALIDNVEIIDNSYFIRRLLNGDTGIPPLLSTSDKKNLILMSSDAGGFKPLMKLCDKIDWRGETFSASKARKWTDEGSKLTQIVDREDFGGKNILIIDDLSIGGGTFKGLATMLKSKNVGKLYLAVSHMTLENLGKDPVTNYFDKVFTTNSKFDNYYSHPEKPKYGDGLVSPGNLEVLKLF